MTPLLLYPARNCLGLVGAAGGVDPPAATLPPVRGTLLPAGACGTLYFMDDQLTTAPGRVIGVGGVFFKSAEPGRLQSWYRDNLGMGAAPEGISFHWRRHDQPEIEHQTAWCVFPGDTSYFGPGRAPFMINYIVDDLDAILAKLAAGGGAIDPKREDHEYGRFAWVFDPDGNKIELWEPR